MYEPVPLLFSPLLCEIHTYVRGSFSLTSVEMLWEKEPSRNSARLLSLFSVYLEKL